jgi:hypothetical protein
MVEIVRELTAYSKQQKAWAYRWNVLSLLSLEFVLQVCMKRRRELKGQLLTAESAVSEQLLSDKSFK